MSENQQTATLLSLITQQLKEIVEAAVQDDSKVITRLISVTEQLHGIQVHLELVGMNRLTHPVPTPELGPFVYPAQGSDEWEAVLNSLRSAIGREPETHEVKACIRGKYPAFIVGQPIRYSGCDKSVDGQVATIVGVKLPLEMNIWMYQTSFDKTRWHPADHLASRPNPA